MPLGIVVRKSPGVTRWARWTWRAVAVLPGAEPADWRELRRDAGAVEYHAATVPLDLWAADTEAYLAGLAARVPAVWVVMRVPAGGAAHGLDVVLATASPYEAQDYTDSGEEIVEPVPMPEGLAAWVRDFAAAHRRDEPFVKRRRGDKRAAASGDDEAPRVRRSSDVYRAPGRRP